MTTRRRLLKGTIATLGGLAASLAIGAEHRPNDVGRKFDADGRVLPFKGNTIICHLPQQGDGSEPFDALLDVYRELPGESWSRKVTALPPSSYHMTVFGGANDKARRYPLWPAGLPLDMPMDECDRVLAERLRTYKLGEDASPYHMRVNPEAPSARETPLTLRLLTADAETETRLRRLRDRLSEVTGIREPDHDRYQFHITLGYQVAPLTDDEDAAWRRSLANWKTMIAQRAPVITLGNPEYCLLNDMFAFKRQFYLT
ncbi:DUF1868 domain-containing protein [Pantoea stewartii]|uniref:DUF1868 domain-containing protein n=1 Tax=Pantoea stewartii TaxID=66269 RepID=UPI0016272C5D|nr:DUF1868 domain-containing protein [Pantoea stewartii]MBC0855305.1 DUF1868 domain-containing protein [Pantoea stewartii]MEB6535867.1 DUF1868 domain-containing protein [Pantoea stewartii]